MDAADVNVTITVALKGDAAKNYQLTNSPYEAASAAKIGKKAVTIKVDSKSKTEGIADPAFTGTVTGLVQDTDLGTITYKRADADKDKEKVGADISIVAEYTENSNYDVTVTPAKLTIKSTQFIVCKRLSLRITYNLIERPRKFRYMTSTTVYLTNFLRNIASINT